MIAGFNLHNLAFDKLRANYNLKCKIVEDLCCYDSQLEMMSVTENTVFAIKEKDAYDLMVPLTANARLCGQENSVTEKVSVRVL